MTKKTVEAVAIWRYVLTLKVASTVCVVMDTLEMDSTAPVSDISFTNKESALALQQIYDPVIIYAVRFQSSIQKKTGLGYCKASINQYMNMLCS